VEHSLPATVPRTKMPKSQRRRERKSLRTQGKLVQNLLSSQSSELRLGGVALRRRFAIRLGASHLRSVLLLDRDRKALSCVAPQAFEGANVEARR